MNQQLIRDLIKVSRLSCCDMEIEFEIKMGKARRGERDFSIH
jgi:hypothetical protein